MGVDKSVLQFIAAQLGDGQYDGGVIVDSSAVVEGDEILVTIDGADYAIQVESF